MLLYKHNRFEMICEAIRWAMKFNEAQNNIGRYAKSIFTGMIFRAVDEWMRQGMKEIPEEVMLLTSIITPITK